MYQSALAYHRIGRDGPSQELEAEGRLGHRVLSPDVPADPLEVACGLRPRATARAGLIDLGDPFATVPPAVVPPPDLPDFSDPIL